MTLRIALCTAIALGGVLASASRLEAQGAAQGDCVIRVVPPNAAASWRDAAAQAQKTIDASDPSSRDCRDIEVDVAGEIATLKFVTRDGRSAIRALRSPSELQPVIDGLLVTLPGDPPLAGSASEKTGPIDDPAPTPEEAAAPPVAAPPERLIKESHVVVEAGAGGRLTFNESFLSPTLVAGAGITLNDWELGVFGSWEPDEEAFNNQAPDHFVMSAVAAGIYAGRRVPMDDVYLLYAADVSLASIDEESSITSERTTSGARIGVRGGLAWPRHAKTRLRPQLGLDFTPSRHRDMLTSVQLPPVPRWGLSLTLELETELL